MRTVQALEAFGTQHEVTLLAPEPGPGDGPPDLPASCRLICYRPPRAWTVAAGLVRAPWRRFPLQSALYEAPDLARKLRALAPEADLGLLQLVRLAPHLRHFGEVPVVADLIDSLALNISRRARFDRPWRRPALSLEARLLAAAERRLLSRAATGVLVCERDREYVAAALPAGIVPRLSVVPLAVESPEPPVAEAEVSAAPPVVALTGNLGYFVNADAVRWWLRRVWRELSRRRPDLRLVVAGARPSRDLRRALARAGAELVDSPPDLRSVLAAATIAVAPMRGGSGVPVKVLEAWSVGVPVVASPWAAAGTQGRSGEDFLLAESPEEWVAAVLALSADPEQRRRLAAAGRARLAAEHSQDRVRHRWLEVVRKAASAGTEEVR